MALKIHFDMETQDPDDAMTLAILATHPRAQLVGVTLTPGGADQYAVARHVLRLLGRLDVPVGSRDPHRTRNSVSPFHTEWLGRPCVFLPSPSEIPEAGAVMRRVLAEHPDATLLTGGPLKNPGALSADPGAPMFRRWVCQGGFAGDALVAPEHRLAKFEGRVTCPTFNLNGDPKGALRLLSDGRIRDRVLVSKNVCHGVAWDREFHARVMAGERTDGVDLVAHGMEMYLRRRPEGKLLHDPLAMAVALDESVVGLRPVEVFRRKGEWGSAPWDGKGEPQARISVSVDREQFFRVLTQAT